MWDACKRPLANLVIDINGCVHALILVIASLKIAECMHAWLYQFHHSWKLGSSQV